MKGEAEGKQRLRRISHCSLNSFPLSLSLSLSLPYSLSSFLPCSLSFTPLLLILLPPVLTLFHSLTPYPPSSRALPSPPWHLSHLVARQLRPRFGAWLSLSQLVCSCLARAFFPPCLFPHCRPVLHSPNCTHTHTHTPHTNTLPSPSRLKPGLRARVEDCASDCMSLGGCLSPQLTQAPLGISKRA